MIGLPHHMWNWKNAEKLGLKVGDELLEVDRDCLNLVQLDMLRIKMRECFHITINDGNNEFKVIFTPVVYRRDLIWDEYARHKEIIEEERKRGRNWELGQKEKGGEVIVYDNWKRGG